MTRTKQPMDETEGTVADRSADGDLPPIETVLRGFARLGLPHRRGAGDLVPEVDGAVEASGPPVYTEASEADET